MICIYLFLVVLLLSNLSRLRWKSFGLFFFFVWSSV